MATLHPPTTDLDRPARPNPPGELPAVDAAVLDALIDDLGAAGSGMLGMLWQSYLQEGEPSVTRLCDAAERNDVEAVCSLAHGLKSSSALLGALPLAGLLQQAEDAARAGGFGLMPIAAAIGAEYLRVALVAESLCQGTS